MRSADLCRELEGVSGCDRILALPDGRQIGYREFGDPQGFPVFALHGTPGSRFKFAGFDAGARELGLRIIAVDRWGYGLTPSRPAGMLADFGCDIEAMADRLGIGRLGVVGVSGGAPFAVSVAARLQNRVAGMALVSPVGPVAGSGAAVKLSRFHAVCFRVLPRIPGVIGGVFGIFRAGLMAAPDLAIRTAMARAAQADRDAICDSSIRRRLVLAFSNGLAPGVAGPVCDMALFGRAWGIDLACVRVTACIWAGLDDRNVPMGAVRALASALPGSELREISGAGHLWIARNSQTVMAWIAAHAPAPSSRR